MRADLIVNGGFEAGLGGWTIANQTGSEGTFFLQSGTTSPVNGFAVPAPPGGSRAAMTDGAGPGSHVLYQDFAVPVGATSYTIGFSLFINNGGGLGIGPGEPDFVTPGTLDFSTPALNQRARVDIIRTTANPFSLIAGDILQNLYETRPGDPLVSGYNARQVDITALLLANQGATLRLRFAEVDNIRPFNFGVDQVTISTPVPDTLPGIMVWATVGGVLAAGAVRRRHAALSNPVATA